MVKSGYNLLETQSFLEDELQRAQSKRTQNILDEYLLMVTMIIEARKRRGASLFYNSKHKANTELKTTNLYQYDYKQCNEQEVQSTELVAKQSKQ